MNILDLMPICYMSPYIAGLSSSLFEIDFFETLTTDGAAQSAYVTNGAPADKNGTHTITANGDAAYSTAQKSSYNSSTKSVYFDGTGDYLSALDHADWNFGTGSFTLDCWVRHDALGNSERYIGQASIGSSAGLWHFWKGADNKLQFYAKNSSDTLLCNIGTNDAVITATDTWYHVAFVRSGTSTYIFVNGISVAITKTVDLSNKDMTDVTGILAVGCYNDGTPIQLVNGYMDNIRLTKGTALWTSNFTISDAGLLYTGSPNFGNLFIGDDISLQSYSESTIKTQGSYALKLVATTGALNQTVTKTLTGGDILDLTGKNTILLDARSTGTGSNLEFNIRDSGNENSGNLFIEAETDITDKNGTHTITANGNAALSKAQFSSYNNSSASIVFDGTGDYLSVLDSEDWNYGSGDFTIDFFMRTTDDSNDLPIISQGVDDGNRFSFYHHRTSGFTLYIRSAGSTVFYQTEGSNNIDNNTWYHIALVRSGNDYTIRKNGTTVKAFTDASALPSLAAVLKIGAKEFVATNDYAGYLDNIRITKGTALWTANFNLNDVELFYAHKETHTITIAAANTYQEESFDISGVADADKDAIDQLQLKVLNAGSARDFYVDNVRAEDTITYMTATGGTITTDGDYKVHSFTSDGTFTVTQLGSIGTVEYLVVAGGGGGGSSLSGGQDGGGGAGGFRTASGFSVAKQGYSITVGAGGTAGSTNGGDSVFSSITSTGGGLGGEYHNGAGAAGGSGGGGSQASGAGGAGTGGQGNAGGTPTSTGYAGGGGGGASAVGGNSYGPNGREGGYGGAGTSSSITGSAITYAGGGAGGSHSLATEGTPQGGAGGGGDGEYNGSSGTNGTANTGGGGGGGGEALAGGNGGSGIVIIRYQFQ